MVIEVLCYICKISSVSHQFYMEIIFRFPNYKKSSLNWIEPVFSPLPDWSAISEENLIKLYAINVPCHEKTCFAICERTTKMQISLRICAVWSVFLLFAA